MNILERIYFRGYGFINILLFSAVEIYVRVENICVIYYINIGCMLLNIKGEF